MERTIIVNPPKNLSPNDAPIFGHSLSYTIRSLIVKEIKDAFVSFSGLTIDSSGLVKECHHAYDFQYDSYLKEAWSYFNEANSNPEKLIELDNDSTYLQIFHPWFNYGHWLFDSLLRLWNVRDKTATMVLLLPSFYSKARFITESLEPFTFKDVFLIPDGKSLLVSNLCLPQIKPVVDSYYKKELLEIRTFYLNYVCNKKLKSLPSSEFIYLSRKKSRRRFVINEKEVEQVVREYGFTTLYADDFGFFEQVSIYSKARYLVSIMGAGLSNILFMKEGASILEFHKRMNETDIHCKTFWYLADTLNFDYYYQFCLSDQPAADIYHANLFVDIHLLRTNLDLMMAGR